MSTYPPAPHLSRHSDLLAAPSRPQAPIPSPSIALQHITGCPRACSSDTGHCTGHSRTPVCREHESGSLCSDSTELLTPNTPPSDLSSDMLGASPSHPVPHRVGTPYPCQTHRCTTTAAQQICSAVRSTVSTTNTQSLYSHRPIPSLVVEPQSPQIGDLSTAARLTRLAETIHSVLVAYSSLPQLYQSPIILSSIRRYDKRAQKLVSGVLRAHTDTRAGMDRYRSRLSVVPSASSHTESCWGPQRDGLRENALETDQGDGEEGLHTRLEEVLSFPTEFRAAADAVGFERDLLSKISDLEYDWWSSEVVANWFGPQPHTVLPARKQGRARLGDRHHVPPILASAEKRIDRCMGGGGGAARHAGASREIVSNSGAGLADVELQSSGCIACCATVHAHPGTAGDPNTNVGIASKPEDLAAATPSVQADFTPVRWKSLETQVPERQSLSVLPVVDNRAALPVQAGAGAQSGNDRHHIYLQLSPAYDLPLKTKTKRPGLETIMMNERATDLIRMSSFVGLWDE